ncbi:response regulator [Virgibacillus dakarensis]|nr:response regulator [Virgibacillus dakarensis]
MKKEILIVDDQPGIRLLLQEVFENNGYHVVTAKTGKEALDKIHSGTFDLMMLDYKLPVVDGVKVLQQLELEEINIPAIVMSGLVEELVKELANYPNVKEVVGKPFNINSICTIVNKLLGCES